jgi:hypothetical protein
MTTECITLQATTRADKLIKKIEYTSIPRAPMVSLAIDFFKLPHVQYDVKKYVSMHVYTYMETQGNPDPATCNCRLMTWNRFEDGL